MTTSLLLVNGAWAWSNARQNGDVAGSSDQYPLLSKRIFVENPNDIFIIFVLLKKRVLSNTPGVLLCPT